MNIPTGGQRPTIESDLLFPIVDLVLFVVWSVSLFGNEASSMKSYLPDDVMPGWCYFSAVCSLSKEEKYMSRLVFGPNILRRLKVIFERSGDVCLASTFPTMEK